MQTFLCISFFFFMSYTFVAKIFSLFYREILCLEILLLKNNIIRRFCDMQTIQKYRLSILRGGGKKRKKKIYIKPKKSKHINKKIKMRYLNFYKIEQNKVIKLRKTSSESSGCFMAEHYDRLTCGKTGLTLARRL